MNKIGIYICNYNGKDFVLGCIRSLKEQNFQGFDICVVDNASTDGTVEAVKAEFPYVEIIVNPENLGGAGGFDKGLKEGLKRGYEYIVLLDNDVILDESLILNMYTFMEENAKVGIVGSKVMIMDLPDTIQDYGDYLDFDKFKEINAFSMEKDGERLPEVNECDYVPTCCVMARRQALLEAGTMPADNFIYYDDIELSHKMKLNGWKVFALGNAKVWHKGGFRKAAVNTFSKYYFLRNRLNFFARYITDDKIDCFIEKTLDEVFSLLYGFNAKKITELFQTTFYAFDDFLHGIRGKAAEHKIMMLSHPATPLDNVVENARRVHIVIDDIKDINKCTDQLWIVHRMIFEMRRLNEGLQVALSFKNSEIDIELIYAALQKLNEDVVVPILHKGSDIDEYDVIFEQCSHVSEVRQNILPRVYIDRYCNCITNNEEYIYFIGTGQSRSFFKNLYRESMRKIIMDIRSSKM